MNFEVLVPEFKKMPMAQESVKRYFPRIQSYTSAKLIEFKTEKKGDSNYKKASDEKEIFKKIDKKSVVVLLDEKGKLFSSQELLTKIENLHQTYEGKKIVFIIGGPYGHGDQLRQKADLIVSLSKLTMNSEVAITMFIEQLYRILTLQAGHPYHNE